MDNTGEVTDDLTKLFYRMMPHIDNATGTNNATLRKREANIIFDMLIDFISDELRRLKEKEKPEPKDEPSGPSDEKEEKDPSEGAKEPEAKEEADEPASPSISEDGGDSKDDNKSSEAEESESKMPKEEKEKAFEEVLAGLGKICDDMSDKTEHSDTSTSPVSDEDDDPEAEGTTPEEGSDFDTTNGEGPEEWDLSYLEDCAAKEEIASATKKQIVKAMTQNANDTRKGRTDKYPSIQQYVEPDAEAIDMFNKQHEELDRIARRVKKNLDKVIKERQKGDRLTGLYTGKQLDM